MDAWGRAALGTDPERALPSDLQGEQLIFQPEAPSSLGNPRGTISEKQGTVTGGSLILLKTVWKA